MQSPLSPAADMPPLWLRAAMCRYCCKSILSILSRNIDSRSGANAQQRFKEARAPSRSLQISISQSPIGDFCNTICHNRTHAPQRESMIAVAALVRADPAQPSVAYQLLPFGFDSFSITLLRLNDP